MSHSPPSGSDAYLELVRQAKQGDAAAYNTLCLELSAQLCTFLWHMLGNEEEARDTAQETLLTGWIKLRTLRDDRYFKSWLYGIAMNKAREFFRKNRRFRWLSLEEHEQLDVTDRLSVTDIETQLAETEILRLALDYLSPTYRACVLLQVVGGFTQSEIATILGLPPHNISNNVKRGLARLTEVYLFLTEERATAMKRRPVQ